MKAEDRLRALELIRPPDQWKDIVERRPRLDVPDRRVTRVATIAVALAVAAAGVGLAAAAFLGGPEQSRPTEPVPAPSPTASPTPQMPPTPYPSPQERPTHSDPWGDPGVLSITCRDGATLIPDREAPAHPDGVHIVVRNPGEVASGLGIRVPGDEGLVSNFGISLEPGDNRLLLPLPPGAAHVRCDGEGFSQDRLRVDVTDPEGWWVSDTLACPEPQPSGRSVGPPQPDPFTAVRLRIPGVRPDDEIVKAGYPEDPHQTSEMLVVRDGQPVAVQVAIHVGAEGWTVGPGSACPGTGIGGV